VNLRDQQVALTQASFLPQATSPAGMNEHPSNSLDFIGFASPIRFFF
jgi:hypothetical protein